MSEEGPLLEELTGPFGVVEDRLRRGCSELTGVEQPLPQALRAEALRIWTELQQDLQRGGSAHEEGRWQPLAQAWSVLLSKVQAEALDRAGVPHPPEHIPVTEKQRLFWRDFACRVEHLPESELEEEGLLEALSAEWTAAATIAEAVQLALRSRPSGGGREVAQDAAGVAAARAAGEAVSCEARRGAAGTTLLPPAAPAEEEEPLLVAVLGPSPEQEYKEGAAFLEEQLTKALPSGAAAEIRFIFCGPEVPEELHGVRSQHSGLAFEHWRALWHDLGRCRGCARDGEEANVGTAEGAAAAPPLAPELYVALNAGTSVAAYAADWQRTLVQLTRGDHGALLLVTGYTLAEAEEARREVGRACGDKAGASSLLPLVCGPNPTASLEGYEKVEIGITPCSFPGKSNYACLLCRLVRQPTG